MNEEKEIEEMAEVLEQAKINALYTIGSLNNGFGHWYANALFSAGYGNVKEAVKEFAEELKRRLKLGVYDWQYAKVDCKTIDNLVKEFNDEDKE